ncbi:major facilitator superfamily protein [Aaosphaeria arxii CBS 175.79]|uniref:Major facilitator superfamily protein n=1 Tax=Aaosphaeria arxii CBS 175.79 TaxID=1450172 RepID=A0A6A5XEL9_9PLEO|nr:major facilitator superfamily protein [Aaosphaeria arxii CBS 175.79]KAF2011353.1 major facilitator superfamily protein [Aaosphaeria arxii CBS 175.79]
MFHKKQCQCPDHQLHGPGLQAIDIPRTDPRHPYNFSKAKKCFIAIIAALVMLNSTVSAGLPGGASPYYSSSFGVTNPFIRLLPSTTYLTGYIVGPLFFSPLSEHLGRRPVLITTATLFLVATIGCAFSPTYACLVCMRFLAGVGGAAPISIIGGIYADIFDDVRVRGQATAAYTVFTTIGTVLSPTIFGYIGLFGWRWCFYVSTMCASVFGLGLLFLPETHLDSIKRHESNRNRCLSCNGIIPAQKSAFLWRNLLRQLCVSTGRPLRLICSEAIVLLSSLYCALVFAILFLLFAGYPYIFHDIYGFSYATAGLAFLPMGVGTALSLPFYLLYDHYHWTETQKGKTWTQIEEYRRLPLACIGGPIFAASLFWLAWTSSKSFHWIIPMMSGLPLAFSLNLILIASFNYLTDAYGAFAASALAAASCSRSICGVLLPMATSAMYTHIGIGWSMSILGAVSVLSVPIPFVFIKYGPLIRRRSPFCTNPVVESIKLY